MIALENLKQVNYKNTNQQNLRDVKSWNWVPKFTTLNKVVKALAGTTATSRQTQKGTTDHGEGW